MATTTDYFTLSVSERIQLVEDIWDSITAEAAGGFPLSDAQKAMLYHRIEAHQANPCTAIPWEEVRVKLFQSKS